MNCANTVAALAKHLRQKLPHITKKFRVLGIYSRQTAKNSARFLEARMIGEFPFPIQRIQSDRGAEFFGLEFQKVRLNNSIKFRPIRPRSPHLNGKVERCESDSFPLEAGQRVVHLLGCPAAF
jgi:transposase InsO family protein